MEFSEADLLLAYRQAKHALYQEQRGLGRLDIAKAESRLPALLDGLAHTLRSTPGWFSATTAGRVWVVPKKAAAQPRNRGTVVIGRDDAAAVRRLDIRLHLGVSVEFAIIEILWLWTFGAALESLLTDSTKANRLKTVAGRTTIDRRARGPFEYWPPAYAEFRSQAFAAAETLLAAGEDCTLATFDLATYYDEIDPDFLIDDVFVERVASSAAKAGIHFDQQEYVRATTTLVAAFGRYRTDCAQLTGLPVTRGIPIGCLSSRVIANLALAPLDDYVRRQPGVQYYGRYVDDIILVASPQIGGSRPAVHIAHKFLPLKSLANSRGNYFIDAELLGRANSRFRLHTSKLRIYQLKGDRGREFLSTIARDVKLIASERRSFLGADGRGSESPLRALMVGPDSNAPVPTLRNVDRFKVERYAASVLLSKVGDALAGC